MKNIIKEMVRDIYYEIVYTSEHYVLLEAINYSFETKEYLVYNKSCKWLGFIQQLFKRLPIDGSATYITLKSKKEGITKIQELENSRNKIGG